MKEMSELKKVSHKYGNPFYIHASVVLLLSSSFICFYRLLLSFHINFGSSNFLAVSLNSFLISITISGSFILLKHVRSGVYTSLLASTFGIVLNLYYIIKECLFLNFAAPEALSFGITLLFYGLALILTFNINLYASQINFGSEGYASSKLKKKDTSKNANPYAIEIVNVTKKYFLGFNVVSALNGLSLKVRKGEFIAIMGPSGSGKSTLLNLIGALDRPSSGKILIDGVDISKLDENGLAKLRNGKIGFIFQAYNLIARSTVLRNMELPALVKGYSREERLRRIHSLLSIVGLEGKAYRRPKTLSGGEQQRVAIARALMNDPPIILADEPTGNVDSKTGRVIIGFLRKLNAERGTTIVLVTHDPEVARMTDRIVYIRDGKIVREEILRGD